MKRLEPLDVALEGLNLVEAGAGTGKTYNITLLVARLVAELGLPVEQVLVVTFTEAATAELRDALRERLRRVRAALDPGAAGGPEPDDSDRALARRLADRREEAAARVSAALRDFDRAAVFTIHGFCRRALIEHAFDSGAPLDTELDADSGALHEDVARDIWDRMTWGADPDLAAALLGRLGGPRGLGKIVGLAAEQPDLTLLGGEDADPADRPDPRPAFEAARGLWRASSGEIAALLQASLAAGDLKANHYSAAKIASVAAILDGFFSARRPPPDGREALAYFAKGRVATGTKKNAALAGRTPAHPFFDAADGLSGVLAGQAAHLELECIGALRRAFGLARELIAERKAGSRARSFADLLLDMDGALADRIRGPRLAGELARRFRAALIDEFQDTDRVQWRIFRRLFAGGGTPLFLIGDPKQAIYSFRGGDVYTYLAAAADAGDSRHTLAVNWRSDPAVLDAVNALFSAVPAPFVDGRIGHRPALPAPGAASRLRIGGGAAPGLQLLFLPRRPDAEPRRLAPKGAVERGIAELVADDLARLLSGEATVEDPKTGETRALAPSDVAILVPKNAHTGWLLAALRRRRIPAVPWSEGSVFHTAEAEELAAVMAALADPADAGAVRAALATGLLGLDAPALARLAEDDVARQAWATRFEGWRDLWERRGFVHAIQAVFDCDAVGGVPALARLMAFAGGERKVTNLRHLAHLAHAAASRDRLAPAGLRRWLDLQRSSRGTAGRDRDQLELESDARAVKLITIHKSKGLEFDVVYLPWSWDDGGLGRSAEPFVFHDAATGDRPCLELGSAARDRHRQQAERELAAEKARLLYVGLTRARRQCRAVWGAINGAQLSALGRLLHAPDGGRIKDMTDGELLAELDELGRRTAGAVGVSALEDRGARYDARPPAEAGILAARLLSRPLPAARRVSSFSGLVADAPVPDREDAVEDARTGADPGEIPLAALPAGRGMGTCLHGILERADLATAGRRELADLAAAHLAAGGFDAAAWAGPVAEALDGVLHAPLDASGMRLADLDAGKRAAELEFVLPVAAARPLTGRDLAAALRTGPGGLSPSYLDRVRSLGTIPPGWLRGFVDLVFEREGRFFLLDYKSNHLGPRWGDYARSALERAMEEHHYHLQQHLYAVAVHRFLASRVPGYSYDGHFGGAFHLFLRGMRPSGGGVFAARPSRAVVEALDGLLAGAAPGGGEA